MSRGEFATLAGFEQGPKNSSAASVIAPRSTIQRMKRAGISYRSVVMAQRFYANIALNKKGKGGRVNDSAIHRSLLLGSIARGYKK
jgi:hypothetical protein